MTTTLKPGDDFPENVKFSYIPYQPENEAVTACGIPQPYDASKGKFVYCIIHQQRGGRTRRRFGNRNHNRNRQDPSCGLHCISA